MYLVNADVETIPNVFKTSCCKKNDSNECSTLIMYFLVDPCVKKDLFLNIAVKLSVKSEYTYMYLIFSSLNVYGMEFTQQLKERKIHGS